MKDTSEGIEPRQSSSAMRRSFFASLVIFLLFACLACLAFAFGVGFQKYLALSRGLPNVERFKKPDFREGTQIFADNGVLIGEFYLQRALRCSFERESADPSGCVLGRGTREFLEAPSGPYQENCRCCNQCYPAQKS